MYVGLMKELNNREIFPISPPPPPRGVVGWLGGVCFRVCWGLIMKELNNREIVCLLAFSRSPYVFSELVVNAANDLLQLDKVDDSCMFHVCVCVCVHACMLAFVFFQFVLFCGYAIFLVFSRFSVY